MRISCRLPRRRRSDGEDGIAMVVVVGSMAVVTLFLLGSLAVVVNNTAPSRRDQDDKAALAAAQAGIDDYVARLNADDGYWQNGNTDASNTALTSSSTALGLTVPSSGAAGASFKYQVLSSTDQTALDGTIRLRVTGLSGPGSTAASKVQRVLTAVLKPKGFLNYGYFSDYESTDPALFMSDPVYLTRNGSGHSGSRYEYAAYPSQVCQHYYDGRSTSPSSFQASAANPIREWDTYTNTYTATTWTSGTAAIASGSDCSDIQWTTGDVVNGPLHSNDALKIAGSVTFTDVTESSWPDCDPTGPVHRTNCWWSTGTPSGSIRPKFAPALPVPSANTGLLQYVDPGGTSTPASDRGCKYTGATKITFSGSTMTVHSPGTTSAPSRCLNTANRNNPQSGLAIPPVIYVDATAGACASVGYPITNEYTGGNGPDYTCTRGTAFVSGSSVTGQVTLAAKDDIVLTGDLTLASTPATNIVGLIAGNYVWVYHPVRSTWSGYTNLLSTPVRNIQAAILALNHSFVVQDWDKGAVLSTVGNDATKLNVTGAIAQKYRGPVGTGTSSSPSTGYLKNYVYDERLKNLQPPHFITPDASPWGISTVTDG